MRFLTVLVVGAMLMGSAAKAQAAPGPSSETELQRLESGKWRPSSIGGMRGVAKLFAPDFTTVEYGADFDGLVYRKEGAPRAGGVDDEKLAAALDGADFQLTEWKFLHPSPAVTVVSYRVTAPQMAWTAYATSIWVKRNGGWKTIFYQASRAKPRSAP